MRGTAPRQPGFTLIELLVVLVVLAATAALVGPRFAAALDGIQLRGATRELASAFRAARTQALSERTDVAVTINVKEHAYRVSSAQRIHDLPQEASIKLTAGQRELGANAEGSITFFPDGSATGGRVELSWSGRHYIVDVQWLTGRVRILD